MSRKNGKNVKKTKFFFFFFMQNIQKHPGARGASGCGKGTEQAKDFLKDAALRRQAMRKRKEAVTQ